MNDVSVLATDETLVRQIHLVNGNTDLVSEAVCLACLLSVGEGQAWRYHDMTFRSDVLDARLAVAVARTDFYQHLRKDHGFNAEFSIEAARRL